MPRYTVTARRTDGAEHTVHVKASNEQDAKDKGFRKLSGGLGRLDAYLTGNGWDRDTVKAQRT